MERIYEIENWKDLVFLGLWINERWKRTFKEYAIVYNNDMEHSVFFQDKLNLYDFLSIYFSEADTCVGVSLREECFLGKTGDLVFLQFPEENKKIEKKETDPPEDFIKWLIERYYNNKEWKEKYWRFSFKGLWRIFRKEFVDDLYYQV